MSHSIEQARRFARIVLDPATFDHALRVEQRLYASTEPVRVAALLHDVIEDTPATYADLVAFGFGPAAGIVDIVTRRYGETYRAFIDRIAASGERRAIRVKLADLRDNMARTDDPAKAKALRPRYERALRILTAALEGGAA